MLKLGVDAGSGALLDLSRGIVKAGGGHFYTAIN